MFTIIHSITTLQVINVNNTTDGTNRNQHHVLPDGIYERHNITSMMY